MAQLWSKHICDHLRCYKTDIGITLGSLIVSFLGWHLILYHFSLLKHFPGPSFARFTNLWRLLLVVKADYAPTMKRLHEKYGPLVRIGPIHWAFPKSDFYKNTAAVVDGKIRYHLFSETDNVAHAHLKRPIAWYYKAKSVLDKESLIDEVICELLECLDDRFVDRDKTFDLGSWLGYYAWDTVSAVKFSKRFGYMEKDYDFDGTLHIANQSIHYLGMISQVPWLDYFLDRNPIVRLGSSNLYNVTGIALGSLGPRLKDEHPNFNVSKPDYLQHVIDAKETHPNVADDLTIVDFLLLNLIADADTTTIVVRALFYYALRSPRVRKRLGDEVLAAGIDASCPDPFRIARSLPYLEAVCREAMRMHPSVSMSMERIVPEPGLKLPNGRFIPAGTIVGMNPYILGRNKAIYGDDADEFRPERWLRRDNESDADHQTHMRPWNAADLTFGAGSRICLGKNLSMMDMHKVVASLIARYEIELIDPNEQWQALSRWFSYIKGGLTCRLESRRAG
ncbi:cytochrome P450 [Xylariaceae sp. FL0016]|nr:cytochrome P450 [Xylariaceae sp. FL0016]